MPKGRYPRSPSPEQVAAGLTLAELAWTHRRVPHREALDHLATIMPRERAWELLQSKLMRKALPPGCRMTATHFIFD